MKISVVHKKPAAKHLFYPDDVWTEEFLAIFSRSEIRKSFTIKQLQRLKALGFEVTVREEMQKIDEVQI